MKNSSNYLKSGYDNLLQRNIYPGDVLADNINSEEVLQDGSMSLSNLSGKARIIESAFNTDGNLINDIINSKLDTESQQILKAFNVNTDDYSGAVKAGDITWNLDTGAWESGAGVVVSKAGIIGASVSGVTFSLNAATGDATFAGDLLGASGTFGSVYSANSGYRIGILTSGGIGQLATYNGTTLIGAIYTDANGWMRLVAPSNSIMLSSGGSNVLEVSISGADPATNDTFDLGKTSKRWRNLWLSGSATITTGLTTGSINCTSVTASNVYANCSGSHTGSFSGNVSVSGGYSGSFEVMTLLRLNLNASGEVQRDSNSYYYQKTLTASAGILMSVSGNSTVEHTTFLT